MKKTGGLGLKLHTHAARCACVLVNNDEISIYHILHLSQLSLPIRHDTRYTISVSSTLIVQPFDNLGAKRTSADRITRSDKLHKCRTAVLELHVRHP